MKRFLVSLIFVALILITLNSNPQSRVLVAQTPPLAGACPSGYHGASWQRCPMNDVANEPALPCQQVNVCLPNCPEGYRQASHSYADVDGEPACVPAKTATLCSPLNLQLFYVHAVPVVWHWRVEISEKCATSRLHTPIQPVYDQVKEQLRGEAVARFRVVVGHDGKVTGSTLLSGGYTTLPPNVESNPLRPNVFSDLAAKTINRLRFRPYLIYGSPMEFQTTITIPFELRK